MNTVFSALIIASAICNAGICVEPPAAGKWSEMRTWRFTAQRDTRAMFFLDLWSDKRAPEQITVAPGASHTFSRDQLAAVTLKAGQSVTFTGPACGQWQIDMDTDGDTRTWEGGWSVDLGKCALTATPQPTAAHTATPQPSATPIAPSATPTVTPAPAVPTATWTPIASSTSSPRDPIAPTATATQRPTGIDGEIPPEPTMSAPRAPGVVWLPEVLR